MMDWFLERQLKILLILAVLCSVLTAAVNGRWPAAVAGSIIAAALVFVGQKLYQGDTTENWLTLKYGEMLRNIVGGVFFLFGWSIFLRVVFAGSIAAALLRAG